ncbi:hypothetical protein Bbelb_441740 [Branchiostoma belcheri]|nr:hypothetical protein Bbelb_441740 [Branchiostoma belcheri]
MDEAAIGQDRPLIDRLDTGSLIPVKRSSGRKLENIGSGKSYVGNFGDIRDIWPGVSLAVSSIIDVDVIITLGKRHRHNNQTCQSSHMDTVLDISAEAVSPGRRDLALMDERVALINARPST